MRYFLLISLSILGCFSALRGQEVPAKIIIESSTTVNPWNHLEVNNKPSTFQFAIVTDRTGSVRPGVFPDAVNKLNLLQPEFVMSVGDLISGYTEDEEKIDQEWDEFTGFISKLQMPFFYLPGNHDYINDVMARKWKERFGKDYYHFVYKDVLFLCLNSEELKRGSGRGYIDLPQFEYAAKVLEDHPEVKWTMVFLHQPLWDQEDPGMWPALEELMADRKHTVFAGHRHRYVKYDRNENNYFVLATTGGGSSLRGPAFGEFDHVVWITMTEDGPIMANLILDGIWDENVRTEEMLERSRPWMEHTLMKIPPLTPNTVNFASGNTPMTFSNPADIPMKVELDIKSSASLWAKTDQIMLEIPPNSVETVSLPLRGDRKVKLNELTPIQLTPTFTFEVEGEPTLSWMESLAFQPLQSYALVRPEETIDVDGELSDWDNLAFHIDSPIVDSDPFAHQGPSDGKFNFDLRHDGRFIYLCAEVMDDEIFVKEGEEFWHDRVQFLVDARPIDEVSGVSSSRAFRDWLLLRVVPGRKGQAALYRPDRLPEGIQVATKVRGKRYVVEVAIPMSYVKSLQGENWESIRVNIAVRDSDKKGEHVSELYWQPDWRNEPKVIGTGIFFQN